MTKETVCVCRDVCCSVAQGGHAAAALDGSVVLFVSHSGQTFPTLNAARAILAECRRTRQKRRVFAASCTRDTEIAGIIADSSKRGAEERLFSSGAGVRPAEVHDYCSSHLSPQHLSFSSLPISQFQASPTSLFSSLAH